MKIKTFFSASRLIAFGFAAIILLGTLLLALPASNKSGHALPFLDALFTAASATCVTGLTIHDTWTQFNGLGQAVILILIQVGGLGFMSFAILFSMALGRRIGLRQRYYMMEAVSANRLSGIVVLARRILFGTLIVELVGAILLCIRFIPDMGVKMGIWFSVFHSVSAFCNAGFDLMGALNSGSSLAAYAFSPLVNITIMLLIIIGGVGFIIWDDVLTNKWRFNKYALHVRVVLIFSGIFIASSFVLFLIVERNTAFAGMAPGRRVLAALFQAVTPRTAGFSTVDMSSLSESGTILTIFLMVIGAAPGSTGGGAKITTVVVVIMGVSAYLRRKENVNILNRRLEQPLVRRAFAALIFYIILGVFGGFLIALDHRFSLKESVFESFSALGTVGLSMGITPSLGILGRLVLIVLMYVGRVGSLTVFTTTSDQMTPHEAKNPVGQIVIG